MEHLATPGRLGGSVPTPRRRRAATSSLRRLRVRPGRRTIATLITAVLSGGTAIAFVVVAQGIRFGDCGSGCVPGSPWAPGGWAITQELALAWPALLAAGGLVWAVGAARRRIAKLMWILMFGLLLEWCVFTTTIESPAAAVALLLAGAAGLLGLALSTSDG